MREELVEKNPKKLIELAKNGDKNAFGLLYELYFVPVFRYVYFRVRSKLEAEDITQEIFLKAFEKIENFEIKKESPLNYFFTLARNKIIDYWRKKKENSIDNNFLKMKEKENLQELIEKKNEIEILKREIEKLSEDQKEVIILKFINGLSNKEISLLLGKSEEAIRKLQSRALKNLRQKFKELKIL